jgi:hypothetical protein
MSRTPAERIDELLKANEEYRQRAIAAEGIAKAEAYRATFWQSECEKHSGLREAAQNEVKRLELKLAGSMPSLFDYAS